MTKTTARTRPRGHRRLGAAALAALFLTTCAAPRTTRQAPSPRSAPAAPRKTVLDEGPVRLEVLDEGHWRMVVVRPPYAPASLTLSADELWPAHADAVPFQHAAFFDEPPPAPPPAWAQQLWRDYRARYGTFLLPPADQVASSRLRLALQMSVQYLPAGLVDAARQMLTDPAFYAGLGLGLGICLAAWLAPEPVFTKGTAIIITTALMLMFTVAEIRNVMAVLWRLYQASEAAESLEELEAAGRNFVRAASGTVLRVLAVLAGRRLGRAFPEVPQGGFRSVRFMRLTTPDGAVVGGRFVVTAATVIADGSLVLAGAALGAAGSTGPINPCVAKKGGGYQGHHIATRENSRSAQRGGPWTPRFEKIFEQANMSLNDPANVVNLNGHYGPHPEAYHAAVYEQLLGALGDCVEPSTCRPRLIAALRNLVTDICTPGSLLNRLITRQ